MTDTAGTTINNYANQDIQIANDDGHDTKQSSDLSIKKEINDSSESHSHSMEEKRDRSRARSRSRSRENEAVQMPDPSCYGPPKTSGDHCGGQKSRNGRDSWLLEKIKRDFKYVEDDKNSGFKTLSRKSTAIPYQHECILHPDQVLHFSFSVHIHHPALSLCILSWLSFGIQLIYTFDCSICG